MPSPMPPKPPRSFWARSLKFQVTGPALLSAGYWRPASCTPMFVRFLQKGRRAGAGLVMNTWTSSGHRLFQEVGAEGFIPVRNGLDLVFLHQDFRMMSHVGREV